MQLRTSYVHARSRLTILRDLDDQDCDPGCQERSVTPFMRGSTGCRANWSNRRAATPLPTNLRGGAKTTVIDGLLARDLITKFQHPNHVGYYLTDAAYATVGCKRKMPAPVVATEQQVTGAFLPEFRQWPEGRLWPRSRPTGQKVEGQVYYQLPAIRGGRFFGSSMPLDGRKCEFALAPVSCHSRFGLECQWQLCGHMAQPSHSAMTCRSMCHRNFEACRSLNGGFMASKLERDLAGCGQFWPFECAKTRWAERRVTDREPAARFSGMQFWTSAKADSNRCSESGSYAPVTCCSTRNFLQRKLPCLANKSSRTKI